MQSRCFIIFITLPANAEPGAAPRCPWSGFTTGRGREAAGTTAALTRASNNVLGQSEGPGLPLTRSRHQRGNSPRLTLPEPPEDKERLGRLKTKYTGKQKHTNPELRIGLEKERSGHV